MSEEPDRLTFTLLEAIRTRDWETLQDLTLSADPETRAAAYLAADCIPPAFSSGTVCDTPTTVERDFSILSMGLRKRKYPMKLVCRQKTSTCKF